MLGTTIRKCFSIYLHAFLISADQPVFFPPDTPETDGGNGGIYVVGAIFATLSLFYLMLPLLGAFGRSRLFAIGPALSLFLNCISLLWIIVTFLVTTAFFVGFKRRIGNTCDNVAQFGPDAIEQCDDLFIAYESFIAAWTMLTVALLGGLVLSAYQIGRYAGIPTEEKTTYVTRTERPVMATTA